MELSELTTEERRAMCALIEHLVRSDGQITEQEIEAVSAIAGAVGDEVWRESFRSVRLLARDREAVLALARTVLRPGARRRILQSMHRVAASDSLAASEVELMDQVVALWGDP